MVFLLCEDRRVTIQRPLDCFGVGKLPKGLLFTLSLGSFFNFFGNLPCRNSTDSGAHYNAYWSQDQPSGDHSTNST